MLKGRILKLAAATVTITSAMSLTGMSATSASTATLFHICITGSASPPLCIADGNHNQIAYISTNTTRADIAFLGPYTIPGDSTDWWELMNQEGMCLTVSLNTEWIVYWETCQPTDHQEYWDNHPGLQFENADGNDSFTKDTWLVDFGPAGPHGSDLNLITDTAPPIPWTESGLS